MADSHFVPLAERIVDGLLTSDPVLASRAGDHRQDGALPDLSASGVAEQVMMLRDASTALSGVDPDGLDAAERVDHEQLLSLVERVLFGLTDVREHEWNPLSHNPGELLYTLVARPFAPAADRLEAITSRLSLVPDALATARATLRDCPRVHVETAVGQFRGGAAFVRTEVPRLLAEAPGMASTVEPAVAGAVAALESFAGWLAELATTPDVGRDPRLGRRLWEAKLWHTLDTELTAAELLRRARENFEQVTDAIRAAAAALVGGPGDDDTVRAALDSVSQRRPDNDSIVAVARRALTETTTFVDDHDLVTRFDDPCVIQMMPEFARGVAVAYLDAPGPLESADVPTFYCIAPAPAAWSPERVRSYYREYNNHLVGNLTVHEAMPGHFLQLAHSRRYRGSTRVRSVARSGPFVEGWAVYSEQLMVEHGFDGLPGRLQQLKMRLRTTINAMLDQFVHCDGMTEAEAMALMTGRGFQEEGEAAGKWRRALLTSAQLSTYFVGYTEMAAIAAARPAGVPERTWHDAMLSHGSPSPRHLRTLLALSA